MKGRMEEAFECYKIVVILDPQYYDAVVNLGNYFNTKNNNT